MRRYLFAVLAAVLVGVFVFPVAAGAGNKEDVCHSEGNGSYHLISISEKAVAKHIDHGDASPREPVPGLEGFVFGDDCGLVPSNRAPIAVDQNVVSCGLVDGQLSATDPDGDDLENWTVVGTPGVGFTLDQATGSFTIFIPCLTMHRPGPTQWTVDDSHGLTSNTATITFELS